MTRKLYRSESNRMIAGVCGGLGDYIGVDAAIVRVGWLVLSVAIGWGFPAYIVAWIIVPAESRIDVSPRQAVGDGIRDVTQTTWRFAKEALKTLRHKEQTQGDSTGEEQAAPKEDSQE